MLQGEKKKLLRREKKRKKKLKANLNILLKSLSLNKIHSFILLTLQKELKGILLDFKF